MRILFFNRWVGCHVGGTEKHIVGLATRLAERGHEVHILTTAGAELDNQHGLNIWSVSKNKRELPYSRGIREDPFLIIYASIFLVKAIPRLLQMRALGIKFEVISVHSPLEGLVMLIFRKILQIPYVFVLEGYTKREVWLAKFADAVVAISNSVAERCAAERGYKPLVINIGTDLAVYNATGPRLPKPNSRSLILTVSRLSAHKRVDILIEASKKLPSKLGTENTFHVWIGGDGKDRQGLERLTRIDGLESVVEFLGRIPEEDLPRYYRSADVFVSCEAAPDDYWITCQEAICCGVPVIWSSEKADFLNLAISKWGLAVPPGQPEVLAQAIATILQDDQLRKKLIDRGLTLSHEFDWNAIIRKYENAYEFVKRYRGNEQATPSKAVEME